MVERILTSRTKVDLITTRLLSSSECCVTTASAREKMQALWFTAGEREENIAHGARKSAGTRSCAAQRRAPTGRPC